MKSERRHELQQNSLARFIENFPVMVRLYADRILLGAVLVALVIVLIRWRMSSTASHDATIQADLSSARDSALQLARIGSTGPADKMAAERSDTISKVNQKIDAAVENSSGHDTAVQARALVTKGDLNWALANAPELPGAATQPSLRLPRTNDEYLEQAATAYENVLKNYPSEEYSVLEATFGLAAVAENRGQWDQAEKIYKQIQDSNAAQVYKNLADARLAKLPEIKQPLLVGTLTTRPAEVETTPTSLPASQPATTEPATTQPATTQTAK